MSKNIYMHTINGRPAYYVDGMQICYLNQWNRVNFDDVFVDSLDAIRRQQRWSRQWREQNHIRETPQGSYGYIRVRTER